MNYKSLTIIALALCLCIAVPASAMWNNGNWIADNSNEGYNVHFDPQTGVTSKYKDNNPVNEIKASENGNGGIAEGSIRAGYSTLSDTIYVRNVLQDANVSPMVIKVNPDAKFRIPEPGNGVLAPGNYSATLDNFNLPDETVYFTIAANQQGPTYIAFVGQAASAEPAKVVAEPTQTQCVQKMKDVTTIVKGLVQHDSLHISADYEHLHYNVLFGDPNVGILKELRVVYKYEWSCTDYEGWGRDRHCVRGDYDLKIKSAKYGSFCGPESVPFGYTLKTVAEDVDMNIHHST